MPARWSLFGGVFLKSLFALANIAAGQHLMLSAEVKPPAIESQTDSSRIAADSTAPPRVSISSALQRLKPRFDAGYHAAPVHPYFRDDQRVINDMRRLVFLVDRTAVSGLESIPELVAIAQQMPVAKQTAIIRLSAAGSVANVAAENVTKHLRRRKLNFVRVEVEKVLCQTNWRGVHLSLARSLDKQTYAVSVPELRAAYSRVDHPKFVSQSFHLAPLPRLAFSYTRWNELNIFNAFYALPGGFCLVSHDYTRNLTLLGWRLQKNKNWAGIFFMQNRRVSAGDWLRADVWLVW